MASTKIATLIIRTIAKPISNSLKGQAKQHPRFREFCVGFAQRMHRAEVTMRTQLMGEPAKHIRPLSETRAIENGANAIAEGFLFSVAAALIIGETWRSSRSQSKRRDEVNDHLDSLATQLAELNTKVECLAEKWETDITEERRRSDELSLVLERIVNIGLRSSWSEFHDTPLVIPRINLPPRGQQPDTSSDSPPGTYSDLSPGDETSVDINTPTSSSQR